jgi:uncharacterized membrane protein
VGKGKKEKQGSQTKGAVTQKPAPVAPVATPEPSVPQPIDLPRVTAQLAQIRASLFAGPIPTPEMLRGYEEICTGAAGRILGNWEKQTDHRIECEKKVLADDSWRSWAGLWAGLVIALVCVGCGTAAILCGHDAAGATVATATVVALAGVFVYGSTIRKKERAERLQALVGNKQIAHGEQQSSSEPSVPSGKGPATGETHGLAAGR